MAESRKRTGPEADAGGAACPVGFCPVGMFLTMAGQARPEAVDHLMAAGRELVLAFNAILQTRASQVDRTSPLERIEVE
ncbi:MAG TPA: hypothetical protein VJ868_01090 [Actinomycetota bacterium]|jgi:hypothetical protein|nr:hypothetical protein [Actinomycetota bacterium]